MGPFGNGNPSQLSDEDLSEMFADDDGGTEPGEVVNETGDPTATPPPEDPEPVEAEFSAPDWGPEPVEEPEQEPVEEPEPAPAEAAAPRLAKKYDTPEELENAYLEVQTGFTRVAQDNARMRAQNQQLQQQIQAQSEQMNQIIQFLQEDAAERDPEFAERLEQERMLQAAIDQRLGPVSEQFQAQQQQQQRQAMIASQQEAVKQFYAAHPDVPPQSPADVAVAQSFQQLLAAGVPMNAANPEHFEIAYEAAQNPQFAMELAMAPGALNIQGGVARLRERAGGTIAPQQGPPTQGGTRPRAPARRKVETFVEVGSGGAPAEAAPGQTLDEFEEAWDWYQENGSKGPLFGSGR